MKWAEGMTVPTIEQNAEPEILWWVGCPRYGCPRTKDRAGLCEDIECGRRKLRGAWKERSLHR